MVPVIGVVGGIGMLGPLAWTALKVGALSYGGGFVIIPLMQGDAVDRYHWLTPTQFLYAVALGQLTPGPMVHTVAVAGCAAAGLGEGLARASMIVGNKAAPGRPHRTRSRVAERRPATRDASVQSEPTLAYAYASPRRDRCLRNGSREFPRIRLRKRRSWLGHETADDVADSDTEAPDGTVE